MTGTLQQVDVGRSPDPLARPARVTRWWMVAGACSLPVIVWAAWSTAPREAARAVANNTPVLTPARSQQRPPLQLAAFDAPIWTLDPAPVTPPGPPPPLRLQLVGMVRDGGAEGALKAVIYNQETDELIVVAEGAQVGTRGVTRIDAAGVTLSDGRRLLMEGGTP